METNKQIAIIGYGFVGKATEYLFDRFYPGTDIQIHDPDEGYEIENWNVLNMLLYVFQLT